MNRVILVWTVRSTKMEELLSNHTTWCPIKPWWGLTRCWCLLPEFCCGIKYIDCRECWGPACPTVASIGVLLSINNCTPVPPSSLRLMLWWGRPWWGCHGSPCTREVNVQDTSSQFMETTSYHFVSNIPCVTVLSFSQRKLNLLYMSEQ